MDNMENTPPYMDTNKAYTLCVDSDHLSKVVTNGGHLSRVDTSAPGHLDTQERHSAVRVDTSHCVRTHNGRIVSTSVFTVSTHLSTRTYSDLCSLSSQDTSSVSLLGPHSPVDRMSPVDKLSPSYQNSPIS